MIAKPTFPALILMIALSSSASANHGEFSVCNKSGSKISMFVAYRTGLGLLQDRWSVRGPYSINNSACFKLFRPISDWLHMYVAFRKEGTLFGYSDYIAPLESNNNFVKSLNTGKKMCVKNRAFRYKNSEIGMATCSPGYEQLKISGFINARSIPLNQHYSNILYVK